ncbi:MAG: hypothetical protein H7222_02205 [Methylotenera sp.]|nr:hypothetical protein [Oligoflexia bacterium]
MTTTKNYFRHFSLFATTVGLVLLGLNAPTKADSRAQAPLPRHSQVEAAHHKFILLESINHNGEYEVEVKLDEHWLLMPETSYTVLYGRDIDGDGKIDLWFTIGKRSEVQMIARPQVGSNPWTTATGILTEHSSDLGRWYTSIAFMMVAKGASLAVAHDQQVFEKVLFQQLDLLDMDYRLDQLQAQLKTPEQIANLGHFRQIVADGWADIDHTIHQDRYRDFWLYAAGDLTLYYSCVKLFSFIGGIFGKTFESLTQTEFSQGITRSLGEFTSSVAEKMEVAMKKIPFRSAGGAEVKSASGAGIVDMVNAQLARMKPPMRVRAALRYFEARSRIARMAMNGLRTVGTATVDGVKQLGYMGLTQSLQVVAEYNSRKKDFYDPSYAIIAGKMTSDKDFVQDMAYMTNETFWMASVASRRDMSLMKRSSICGAIGFTDSIAMNLLIKGEADPVRIAFDTSWEVTAGNLQTQLDFKMIQLFEGFAERQSNPALKFVGYAMKWIAPAADQYLGYAGYARASAYVTDYGKSRKSPKESTAPSAKAQKLAEPVPGSTLQLIPILAPIN